MKVALTGDVALDLLAPYFREAGYDVYVPPGFGAWRQELLDAGSGLRRFAPDLVFDVTAHDAALAQEVPGFFDERMRTLAAMPYSLAGIRALVDELGWACRRAPKKVLAVDADNTLWRGILSEDGKDALAPFVDFQRALLALRAEGVLLVLASKNDPVFPFMRADMPLADGDFAALKVNWAPKAGNLVEACRELNLGADSVVFLDDNPHERAQMAAHLPEVTVAPWNGVPSPSLARRLKEYFFSDMGKTAEDRLRADGYRAEAARREVAARYASVDDYLVDLHLRVAPAAASEADLDRLAQMAGKTNQFNATTLRRTRGEFAALLSDPTKRVFVFRTSDRFGEQGVVCYVVAGVCAGRVTECWRSCRAGGGTRERFAHRQVCDTLGYEPAIDYAPTAKNAPFKAFLDAGPAGTTYYREIQP